MGDHCGAQMKYIVGLLFLSLFGGEFAAPPPPIVRAGVTVSVAEMRERATAEIWSGKGLPTGGVHAIERGVASPLTSLKPYNLARVDRLTIDMGITASMPWVFRPKQSNGRAAIYHAGHGANFTSVIGSNGREELMADLVNAGYTLVGMIMPWDGSLEAHRALPAPTAELNHLRFFIEPVVRAINHMTSEGFDGVFMVGFSGGGWTVTLAAAIDTRIKVSATIAGSLPLYMAHERDWEQELPGLADFLDYTDLHVMGVDGGREQLQILNSHDLCCFKRSTYRDYLPYEFDVTYAARRAGGKWSLMWAEQYMHSIGIDSRAAVFQLFERH